MKLEKNHRAGQFPISVRPDLVPDNYYTLYFETIKQHKFDQSRYLGINIDSTISTEYWTDHDNFIGLSIHSNGSNAFHI